MQRRIARSAIGSRGNVALGALYPTPPKDARKQKSPPQGGDGFKRKSEERYSPGEFVSYLTFGRRLLHASWPTNTSLSSGTSSILLRHAKNRKAASYQLATPYFSRCHGIRRVVCHDRSGVSRRDHPTSRSSRRNAQNKSVYRSAFRSPHHPMNSHKSDGYRLGKLRRLYESQFFASEALQLHLSL